MSPTIQHGSGGSDPDPSWMEYYDFIGCVEFNMGTDQGDRML